MKVKKNKKIISVKNQFFAAIRQSRSFSPGFSLRAPCACAPVGKKGIWSRVATLRLSRFFAANQRKSLSMNNLHSMLRCPFLSVESPQSAVQFPLVAAGPWFPALGVRLANPAIGTYAGW
jgi:hypothetical protein